MLTYEDTALCTDLAHHHVIDQIGTFCHYSAYNRCYIVAAVISLVSAVSLKAIYRTRWVRS